MVSICCKDNLPWWEVKTTLVCGYQDKGLWTVLSLCSRQHKLTVLWRKVSWLQQSRRWASSAVEVTVNQSIGAGQSPREPLPFISYQFHKYSFQTNFLQYVSCFFPFSVPHKCKPINKLIESPEMQNVTWTMWYSQHLEGWKEGKGEFPMDNRREVPWASEMTL